MRRQDPNAERGLRVLQTQGLKSGSLYTEKTQRADDVCMASTEHCRTSSDLSITPIFTTFTTAAAPLRATRRAA